MTSDRSTQSSLLVASLALPLAALGFVCGWMGLHLPNLAIDPGYVSRVLDTSDDLARVFRREGGWTYVHLFSATCLLMSAAYFVAAFIALSRRPMSLRIVRGGFLLAYGLGLIWTHLIIRLTGMLLTHDLVYQGVEASSVSVFFLRYTYIAPAAVAGLFVLVCHVQSWRRVALVTYGASSADASHTPAWGDETLEDLRRHGDDPRYRKSLFTSVMAHALVLILMPWFMQLAGCVEPYRVPRGMGDPVVQIVRVVKPKPQEQKRWLLNPRSAISFHVPELDDSEIEEVVEEMTDLTYQTTQNVHAGRPGRGGGKEGGWPDGMDRAEVRFIRLSYRGEAWDDGMNDGPIHKRADMNFLDRFREITGFKTRRHSESHPIRNLARYEKGYAPPFVYMTGTAGIGVSSGDIQVLREYLLEGGMLFADAGSSAWDRNFRSFVGRVFPDKRLLNIADDDPIFQQPFGFPNGAPPLWHHGGFRAMGVKHQGRWVVFYHPGDVKDAWKSDRSGLRPELAEAAYHLGVNIVYYAFTNYLEQTRQHRQ